MRIHRSPYRWLAEALFTLALLGSLSLMALVALGAKTPAPLLPESSEIPPLTCASIGLLADKPGSPLYAAYICKENDPLDPIISRSRHSNVLRVDQYRRGAQLR